MAMSMGNFGLLQMTTPPVLPFGAGSNNLNNNNLNNNFSPQGFSNARISQIQSTMQQGNQQALPWNNNNQQDSLWKMLEQNKKQLANPFGQQFGNVNNNNNNSQNWLNWQQKNDDNDNNNSNESKNWLNWQQDNDDNNKSWQGDNDDNSTSNDQSNNSSWLQKFLDSKNETTSASKDSKEDNKEDSKEDSKDSKDKEEELEELQEQFEEWLEKIEDDRKETYNDLQLFVLLLYPFLILDRPSAFYFASAELLSTVLTKYGINDDDNLIFLLFVQCLDIVALSRGRLRLVDGYQQNWYQEMYDYVLTKLGISDVIRLGSQMIMPQSPAPEYEVR